MLLAKRFLAGLAATAFAAPAIVRASSLMPVKVFAPEPVVVGVDFGEETDRVVWVPSNRCDFDLGLYRGFRALVPVDRAYPLPGQYAVEDGAYVFNRADAAESLSVFYGRQEGRLTLWTTETVDPSTNTPPRPVFRQEGRITLWTAETVKIPVPQR